MVDCTPVSTVRNRRIEKWECPTTSTDCSQLLVRKFGVIEERGGWCAPPKTSLCCTVLSCNWGLRWVRLPVAAGFPAASSIPQHHQLLICLETKPRQQCFCLDHPPNQQLLARNHIAKRINLEGIHKPLGKLLVTSNWSIANWFHKETKEIKLASVLC